MIFAIVDGTGYWFPFVGAILLLWLILAKIDPFIRK